MRIRTVLILLAALISACGEEVAPPPEPGTVPAVIHALGASECSVRLKAIPTLGGLGAAGGPAVAPLTNHAREAGSFEQKCTLKALVRLAADLPAAEASIIVLLADENGRIRSATAEAVGRNGPYSEQIVRALLATALGDWSAREEAVAALRACGVHAAFLVPELLPPLKGAEPVEPEKIEILGKLIPEVPGALEAMAGLLRTRREDIRNQALSALTSSRTVAPELVDPLLAALELEADGFGYAILQAFQKIGPPAAAAVPAIRARLTGYCADEAAPALAEIGKGDPKTIAALRAAVDLGDSPHRLRALPLFAAIWALTGEDEGVVDAARPHLVSGNVSLPIVDALGEMGESAAEAAPALERLTKSSERATTYAAERALRRIRLTTTLQGLAADLESLHA